jgi:hypothetical protein
VVAAAVDHHLLPLVPIRLFLVEVAQLQQIRVMQHTKPVEVWVEQVGWLML